MIELFAKPELDQKALKYWLRYNPETGNFRWNHAGRRIRQHQLAGYVDPEGYRRIRINCKPYAAGRLAYLYMTGRWPEPTIDHINRKNDDNRWSNLREATHQQQVLNRTPYGKVPYRGVAKNGNGYQAKIKRDGKVTCLGTFPEAIEAAIAYQEAAHEYRDRA